MVNYATEKAKVTFPIGVDPRRLVETVEAAGYTAALPQPEQDEAYATSGCATARAAAPT